jgi:predicted porin
LTGRLTWKLGNGLTAQGTIEKQIKEPTTTFGLADDVITYEVRLDKKLDPWTIYGRAFLDHVRPIGDNFDYFKFNWAGGAAYELRKDTEIYAEYSGKFVNEKVTTESYDRTRVGAGIRVKF